MIPSLGATWARTHVPRVHLLRRPPALNRSLVSTSRTRRRSRSVSLLAGSTAGSVQTAGVSAVAAVRRRVAVERTSPVNVAACLVDTPCAVSIAKVSVSASCAARRSPR
jgi:hypothetical protein